MKSKPNRSCEISGELRQGTTSPCHPTAMDCDPTVRAATKDFYDLRNNKKIRNFITAEITVKGYFKFYVENLPKTQPQTGCPGHWLFQVAWDHFLSEGLIRWILLNKNILGLYGNSLVRVQLPHRCCERSSKRSEESVRIGNFSCDLYLRRFASEKGRVRDLWMVTRWKRPFERFATRLSVVKADSIDTPGMGRSTR